MELIGFFLLGLFFVIAIQGHKPSGKTVVAKVIGFEQNYNMSWYPQISPILEYEVDGKKYRCVMFLLTCEDTSENRLLYINKEYRLLYDENNPNRVTTNKRLWW